MQEAPRRVAAVVSADSLPTVLKGVGPKLAATLARSGLRNLRDLLLFFPRRAVLVRHLEIPREDAVGELVRVSGRVQDTRLTWLRGRRSMVTVRFVAADGSRFETRFFNQPYLKNSYEAGSTRLVEGGGVDIHTPDFIGLGRAFGCEVATVTDLDDLKRALIAAAQRKLPTLIEIGQSDFVEGYPMP